MRYLAFLAALALAGCATTTQAPAQFYRAAGQSDQLAIAGTLHQTIGLTSASNDVSITINGQRVAGGTFSGGSMEFHGSYAGKPVLADCAAVAAGNFMYQMTYGFDRTDVKCTVFLAGDRAANFLMVP